MRSTRFWAVVTVCALVVGVSALRHELREKPEPPVSTEVREGMPDLLLSVELPHRSIDQIVAVVEPLLEELLNDVEGVELLRSTYGYGCAELELDANDERRSSILQVLRSRVAAEPRLWPLRRIEPHPAGPFPTVLMILEAPSESAGLQEAGEAVRVALLERPEVAGVVAEGLRRGLPDLVVRVDHERRQKAGLSAEDVYSFLETVELGTSSEQLGEAVILGAGQHRPAVHLKDIATIDRQYLVESRNVSRDERAAVLLRTWAKPGAKLDHDALARVVGDAITPYRDVDFECLEQREVGLIRDASTSCGAVAVHSSPWVPESRGQDTGTHTGCPVVILTRDMAFPVLPAQKPRALLAFFIGEGLAWHRGFD